MKIDRMKIYSNSHNIHSIQPRRFDDGCESNTGRDPWGVNRSGHRGEIIKKRCPVGFKVYHLPAGPMPKAN
jgi:hypothetical protein